MSWRFVDLTEKGEILKTCIKLIHKKKHFVLFWKSGSVKINFCRIEYWIWNLNHLCIKRKYSQNPIKIFSYKIVLPRNDHQLIFNLCSKTWFPNFSQLVVELLKCSADLKALKNLYFLICLIATSFSSIRFIRNLVKRNEKKWLKHLNFQIILKTFAMSFPLKIFK